MPKTTTRKLGAAGPLASKMPIAKSGSSGGASAFRVVAIGASAGGLGACKRLIASLPPDVGMAFILVQHLDPAHESMMVELLAGHTSMPVLQAVEGMPVEPDHFYVIPPGAYLSVADGALKLSRPQGPHGVRLPFDFLLNSTAQEYGGRAVAIVLSGTGTDGSTGLKAITTMSGLVIAQDPGEADYDGMPQSAIATGLVDFVLPVAAMADALVKFGRQEIAAGAAVASVDPAGEDGFAPIIELVRTQTAHDFTLYKQGTLRRRIERRMGMMAVPTGSPGRYLELLKTDPHEIELLAKDLLINVTSFFRDRKVFELLAKETVPELIRTHPPDRTLRVWVVGCSSGEETYSLAIIMLEQVAETKANIKLQIFASDVDPDAVASAREGLYPETIASEVSAPRFARFFSKEEHGYRVSQELRSLVVFTVQDVLSDPPFSRLDLISCRNLMIYLSPEAQAKVLSLFHFALQPGGILLLGSSETAGDTGDRFEVISKAARLYRHIGRSQPGELDFLLKAGDGARAPTRAGPGQTSTRQAAYADLSRRKVAESFAPASVLISTRYEVLYSLGPLDRYLRVAVGYPTHDLLTMAPQRLRTRLRAAIESGRETGKRLVVAGGRVEHDGMSIPFNIDVQPVTDHAEEMVLVCFVEAPATEGHSARGPAATELPRVAELEHELEATRTELAEAVRNLELSSEDQKAINEEALSVNEEFQSTNEELLTSKEELQSLNEELTALNGQLQETLERQRTTFNDLQNVLYSTDVATIFLDADMRIRLFTPATKALFNVIPTDVGRPLSDLNALTGDTTLLVDAGMVLKTREPVEKEIEARAGAWYVRRILPYRAQDGSIEGVVITFVDISDRKRIADALTAAERKAQLANAAKSRFLAAASHDLRQPLQALTLMRGVLARKIRSNKTEQALALVERLDETSVAVTGMLNTMLDINQIEAGVVRTDVVHFQISDLLKRMREEFVDQARLKGLSLGMVPSTAWVLSDPRLLEQILRNLLSNAIKYTENGRVLLGCRRRHGMLSIQIWDTGIGIPAADIRTIFEEFHQLDNAARDRSRGLGLGLSIVDRLAEMLGHRISVSSRPGEGSCFAVEIDLDGKDGATDRVLWQHPTAVERGDGIHRTGTILVVEDDADVREFLTLLLKDDGHSVMTASDGVAALNLVEGAADYPDILLTDYNLPNGLSGLGVSARLREGHSSPLHTIVLTGDISTDALRKIAVEDCLQLNKPIEATELLRAIQLALVERQAAPPTPAATEAIPATDGPASVIFVVDDDVRVRTAIGGALREDGRTVRDFASCEAFLEAYVQGQGACLLIDANLPGMSGLQLLRRLHDMGDRLPAIMITGNGEVSLAVDAMKAGAVDFIEKPVAHAALLESVARALEQPHDPDKLLASQHEAAGHMATLTPKQRQIMTMVLAGQPSKNIAADLGISQRTVENHRASIMKRTGSKSLPALARLAVAAGWDDSGTAPG